MKGILTVTLCEGDLTHDTELWGEMDPYAVLKYGELTYKSHVHENAGKHPKWQDCVYEFPIKQLESEVTLNVFDKDLLKDDLVGGTTILVENLTFKGGVDQWFDIYFKEKPAGKIRLKSSWVPAPKEESKEAKHKSEVAPFSMKIEET